MDISVGLYREMIVFAKDELFPVGEVGDASVASSTDSIGNVITMLAVFYRIRREAVEIRPLVDGKFVFTDDILDGDSVEPYMSDEEWREDAKNAFKDGFRRIDAATTIV